MKEILEKLRKFNVERDWGKFHTPSNIAKSICIEAAELLELFQWGEEPKSTEKLKEELADVLLYSLMLADKYNFNIKEIMIDKINSNEKKYPVEKAKGNSKKYNEYI